MSVSLGTDTWKIEGRARPRALELALTEPQRQQWKEGTGVAPKLFYVSKSGYPWWID